MSFADNQKGVVVRVLHVKLLGARGPSLAGALGDQAGSSTCQYNNSINAPRNSNRFSDNYFFRWNFTR